MTPSSGRALGLRTACFSRSAEFLRRDCAEPRLSSPAEAAGLARGDVIQSANGSPVNAGEQIRQVVLWEQLRQAVKAQESSADSLSSPEPEEWLRLEVSRSGQVREVKVTLAQTPLSA